MNEYTPTDADFEQLRQNVLTRASALDRLQARRRKVSMISAAGVAAAVGIGAAWIALATPDLRENAVYCYSDADQNSTFATVVNPIAEAPDGAEPVQLEASALELCEAAWRAGAVGQTSAPPPDGVELPVPPLQACLRLDGVTSVFPADHREPDQFCRDLGLRAP